MYIIDIRVNEDVSAEQQEVLFSQHVAWFQKHFQAGNFLIVGPFTERERAGVIIAQTANRAELDRILAEDSYYPDLAKYEISEFVPKMVAENIAQFKI